MGCVELTVIWALQYMVLGKSVGRQNYPKHRRECVEGTEKIIKSRYRFCRRRCFLYLIVLPISISVVILLLFG
jgi:hypothetical protein